MSIDVLISCCLVGASVVPGAGLDASSERCDVMLFVPEIPY
jgi:hypothetical protein